MQRTADGYIRVSRVAGRSGEGFISPVEQRADIEAWAKRTKTTILEWHQDLDQSGGTLDWSGFQAALERCRVGQTGGIVAAKLDRLTRSVVGLGSLLTEAERVGFNVVALDLGLDMQAPNGKLVANVLGSVAEWERERRRDDWAVAQRSAIERGVPVGNVPLGFRKRGRHQGFDIDKPAARRVVDIFKRRAAGESYGSIGRRYGLSAGSVRQVIGNEAYLGVARSGAHRNEHAHMPIVARELFAAANATRTSRPVPAGKTTTDRFLVGLARCASCGHTLKVIRDARNGVVSYYCKHHGCGMRAMVQAEPLERLVDEWFREALRHAPRLVDVVEQAKDLEDAQTEMEKAEAELVAFVEQASAIDPRLFHRGLQAREERAASARARVAEVSVRVTAIPAGSLLTLWNDFDAAERRDVLRGFLDRIDVLKGGYTRPAGHVRIYWSDGSIALDGAEDQADAGVATA